MSNCNLFDSVFNGMGGSELYRSQVSPDLFPHQKPMLIENWPIEDREMYVGGVFTPGYAYKDYPQRYMLGAQ